MNTSEIKEMATKYIINTYGERQIALVRGEGCYVWDADGKKYLDFLGGLAVNGLGHCHPKVVKAIQEQAETLLHVSNLYYIEPQAKLAKLLIDNCTMEQCFFCNSGAEANEAAIKLARKYTKEKIDKNRFSIITMENSFHGRTLATITATAQPKYHKGFEPMVSGFKYVPFDNLQAVEEAIDETTCAIMVEPIQSEGGVNVPSDGYLEGLRSICDKKELLLIFDEVQTAMGRLGKLFGYQAYGVEPDILTTAKSLGGGVPIGAMLTFRHIAESFGPGTHASTFGGNPLVTAAAYAAVSALIEENLADNAVKMGEYLTHKLLAIKSKCDAIEGVRGRGLLLGLVLSERSEEAKGEPTGRFTRSFTVDGKDIASKCIENGLLTICTMERVLRFLPPLIINEGHVDEAVEIVEKALIG